MADKQKKYMHIPKEVLQELVDDIAKRTVQYINDKIGDISVDIPTSLELNEESTNETYPPSKVVFDHLQLLAKEFGDASGGGSFGDYKVLSGEFEFLSDANVNKNTLTVTFDTPFDTIPLVIWYGNNKLPSVNPEQNQIEGNVGGPSIIRKNSFTYNNAKQGYVHRYKWVAIDVFRTEENNETDSD